MLSQRVVGSFLGALCGSCLGSPYVYMKSNDLLAISQEIGWELSPPSGDMALCLGATQAIGKYGVCVEKISRAYCHVASSSPDDLDLASSVCFSPHLKTPEAIRDCAAFNQFGTLCSSGVLARQLPIVYASIHWDDDVLTKSIEEDTTLTHDEPYVVECAKAFARCLWLILRGKRRVEIWDYLMEQTHDEKTRDSIVSSYFERPRCDCSDPTDIGIALMTSLYHYWHDTPFVMALRSSILSGGATDANAAATGALCGAAQGSYVVPAAWRKGLEPSEGEANSWRTRARAALETLIRRGERRDTTFDHPLLHSALRSKRFVESRRSGTGKALDVHFPEASYRQKNSR